MKNERFKNINILSSWNVSFLYKIILKKLEICKKFKSYNHRDSFDEVKNVLYTNKKLVFCYTELASGQLQVTTSSTLIINQIEKPDDKILCNNLSFLSSYNSTGTDLLLGKKSILVIACNNVTIITLLTVKLSSFKDLKKVFPEQFKRHKINIPYLVDLKYKALISQVAYKTSCTSCISNYDNDKSTPSSPLINYFVAYSRNDAKSMVGPASGKMLQETLLNKRSIRTMINPERRLENAYDHDTSYNSESRPNDASMLLKSMCELILILMLNLIRLLCTNNVSVASIEKAKSNSCLSSLLIIMSVCQSKNHPSCLWSHRLSFQTLEPRLKSHKDSRGNQILPNRVSTINVLNVKLIIILSIIISYKFKKLITMKLIFIRSNIIYRNLGNIFELINESFTDTSVKWIKCLINLCGDIELNPGPINATFVTLNCRGLKNKNKYNQLLNRINSTQFGSPNLIFAMQETHIEHNSLNYKWKGNHIFTEGCGTKGGLITLLSDNIIVLEEFHLEQEAQISLVEIMESKFKTKLIVVNLHSPCPHDENKMIFFENIKLKVDEFLSKHIDAKVIILGDFNTTFKDDKRNGTTRSSSERNIAIKIDSCLNDLGLTDCWEGYNNKMTWRHGNKMSRLDRVKWSQELSAGGKMEVETDWTFTQSDHCAVIVKLKSIHYGRHDKVVRLDTFFMGNVILKHKFLVELSNRMEQTKETQMNPHQILEFLKMNIRSIAIEISSNNKNEREAEMNNLRHEINFWQSSIEAAASQWFRELAVMKLEESICKRNEILNKRGEFLSNRLQTKWYQEGERGTKYFLNMQRAKGRKLEMTSLKDGSNTIDDTTMIDQMVLNFYKNLYEKGDSKIGNVELIDGFLCNMPAVDEISINQINSPTTIEDLYNTLKSCKDSAPGPDGIPYSIIKLTWRIFGPILFEAWKYSLAIGELSHSHENSYLKLLPKDGKDPSLLKNWRPITLSNCDFKIITKTLAIKMTEGVKNIIGQYQTAYIKGRQITDNLHLLQYSIEKAVKDNKSMMVVSLDAEKAFDSIEHWYIQKLLAKIGLTEFGEVFDLLYKNQNVAIQINGHCAGSYTIKNGVKQGDALSCVLFILGIEPLLRNITHDSDIKGVEFGGVEIPKILSYADDVACIIDPNVTNLQKIFSHYQDMTDMSGLKLNADKTELIRWASNDNSYEIKYKDQTFTLAPCNDMKVNGLYVSFNLAEVNKKNFEKVYESMEKQLLSWSNRYLSLLAKILIFKTFGLSQILFIGTTTTFTKAQESQLNNLIYKFIWNRDMSKAKAPDRIKRNILHNKVKELGFGMIDYRDVVDSIRIRTVLRLIHDKGHPFFKILEKSMNSSVCNIKNVTPIRPSIDSAISLINKIWSKAICNLKEYLSIDLKNTLLNEYIGNLVCKRFEKQRMVLRHKHDRLIEILNQNNNHPVLSKLENKFKGTHTILLENLTDNIVINSNSRALPVDGKLIPFTKTTSSLIRSTLKPHTPLKPKLIIDHDEVTLKHLGRNINKMTNTKLKTVLLRSIHGDIYSGTRLKKFGMTQDDECPRCSLPETIDHQIFSCRYTKKLWHLTSKLTSIPSLTLNDILGHNQLHDRSTLTIHAELINRLLAIERPQMDQVSLLRLVITKLRIVERQIPKLMIDQMLENLNNIT